TVGNTSSPRLDISDFWLLNDWIHFVATIDENGVMKAYRDAVLSGSKIDGLKPNSIYRTKQYIGKSNWSNDRYFKGTIDELRIYDRALSAAEVQALYNMGQ
ncbi:MAG: hypothetical protein CMI23_10270, partial [Opitutae bacterium]|nr:hypothetical protein [Opitutae bacterium]